MIIGGKLKVGAMVRFVPSSCWVGEAGLTPHVNAEVVGTVTEIHEDHRWYRVEYSMGHNPDCIGYECFKF